MLSANRSFQAQFDMFNAITNYAVVWNLYCELKIFVRDVNKEMVLMTRFNGNYIDS